MDIRPIKKQRQSTAPSPPAFIPDELIAEIFSWLDVKTILRFKCLSKSWYTLISDPPFIDKHLKKSSQKQNLVVIWDNHKGGYNVSPIPLHHLIENPSIIIHSHNNTHYMKKGYYIAGSCNGLICLFSKSNLYITQNAMHEDYSIYFWNPSTRKKSEKLGSFCYSTPLDRQDRLDHTNHLSTSFNFAFGYDDSTKTYKVVAFHVEENKPASPKSEVKVFSLGGNCWRNIESFPVIPLNSLDYRHTCLNNGMHLSGTVNWLADRKSFYSFDDYHYITDVEQFVIISLDLSTETYKQLLLPQGFDEVLPQGFDEVPSIRPVLMVLMECLCFSYDTKDNNFVLWKMKEYGVQESWSQLFKISYQNLQDYCFNELYQTACLYKNGDTVIVAKPHHPTDLAMIYNLRDKKVVRIRVKDCIHWSFHANVYVESLVGFT